MFSLLQWHAMCNKEILLSSIKKINSTFKFKNMNFQFNLTENTPNYEIKMFGNANGGGIWI